MSILLDSLSQNRESDSVVREGIVQQPGPFYNGNPSSSIWGRSSSQMASLWRNATSSPVAGGVSPFDFGFPSQVDSTRASVPPPPVDSLHSEKPSIARSSKDPEIFVFGSSSSTSNTSADKNAAGDRGSSFASLSQSLPVEQVQTMLHKMQIESEVSAATFTSPPAAQQPSQAAHESDLSKTFVVGAGSVPPTQPTSFQPMNPRPRFSKLRKSTHPAKGKSVASGDGSGTASPQINIVNVSGTAPQPATFTPRPSPEEAAIFHTGEPSITSSAKPFFFKGNRKEPDVVQQPEANPSKASQPQRAESSSVEESKVKAQGENRDSSSNGSFKGSRINGSFEPWFIPGKTDPPHSFVFQAPVNGESAFTFTAMRESVPVFPEQEQEDEVSKVVAAELGALKFEEKEESAPSSQTQAVPNSRAFMFTAGSSNAESQAGTSDTAATNASESNSFSSSGSFVFKASKGAPSPKKKKDNLKHKKVHTKVKHQHRSAVASLVVEDQGSPMDVSPCPEPETGDRLSPPLAASNSEPEEQEASSVRFQSSSEPCDEVENLRAAAAELNLGRNDESENHDAFNSTKFDSFAFTASCPSAAPAKRRSKRTLKSGSLKTKNNASLRSRSKQEAYGMDGDQTKNKPEQVWRQPSIPSVANMDFSVPSTPPAPARAAVEQACERWRLRGNQAYANGDFPKAEEYYSRGASSVPPNETSQSCIRASMLCYSNRAATRMVVGRMREALADCSRAMAVDPNFLRVRLRAGSCHLALGEIEAAMTYFKDCLYRAKDHDRNDLKLASEASEGLRKTQQAQEYFKQIWELVAANDYLAALRLLNEALPTSPYCETLLELKARCLLSTRKCDEAIQMCDKTLVLAESNWPRDSQSQAIFGFQTVSDYSPKFWRSWVTSKALFYLGRLEESLECLQKLGELLALSGTDKISDVLGVDSESLSQFISLLHELLRHKAAGNEAFQAGRHTEAVEHYTAALACNSEARRFNAVLFCNRAAASQALGHIADAIADSSRAVVLDPKYAKAISRRATLHTSIRDYGQACSDLRKMISLIESLPEQPKDISRKAGSSQHDLKQARERLASAEEDLKKSHPIDHYLILGLEPSCSAVEIKKAYRKLALRHHPDKAGQLLRTDGGEDGKDVGEGIRHDAERLFKLIGEAYAILSDPSKRSRYDSEEELRKLRTRGAMNSSNSTSSENHPRYHQHYERTCRRQRDRWDTWSGYTHQYQRWQSGPDAAQPDTYAHHFNGRYSKNSGRSADFSWDDL